MTLKDFYAAMASYEMLASSLYGRRHYEHIAKHLVEHHPDFDERKKLAEHHAHVFAKDNTSFHKGKFFDAAGVGSKKDSNYYSGVKSK